MGTLHIITFASVFLTFQLVVQVASQERVQSRYARPYNSQNCDSQGRCTAKEGYIEEVVDESYKSDEERPPVVTRDGYPSAPGEGKSGVGSDYKPKLSDSSDLKPVVGRDEYSPKPISSSAGRGDYNPKPVVDRGEYNPKPVSSSVGREEYDPKPVSSSVGREEYNSKPVSSSVGREEYNPKPVSSSAGRGDYNPKPVVDRGEYNPKPVSSSVGREEYNPKPVSSSLGREEYNPKPVSSSVGRDDYNPKPVADRDVYNPKPVSSSIGRGDYNPKPVSSSVGREDYNPKPVSSSAGRGDYNPKPVADRDEYAPKPVRSSVGREEFKPKPVADREGYDTKPVSSHVGRGDYSPKPIADRDGYNLKPVSSSVGRGDYNPDRDVYSSKPVADRDSYPKAVVGSSGTDDYQPKPAVSRDRYDTKPVRAAESYDPKPGDRDAYDSRPIVTGSERRYNRKPKIEPEEHNPKPVPNVGGYRPATNRDSYPAGSGRGYNRKPVVVEEDYNPAVSEGGRGHNRRTSVGRVDSEDEEKYNSKPVRGSGGYFPKPHDKDEYAPKPVETDRNRYKPRPIDDKEDYLPRPVGGEDPYRRPERVDLGGYETAKDDVYRDDYPSDDFDEEIPDRVVDEKCICVPYYQCTDGHIVTDGGGIIDARKRPDPEEELHWDGKFNPSCGPFHVCCNTPETSTVRPYEHRCGVRNPSGINSRILSPSNKGEADFGEWPWQAAVLKAEGKINIFQCGGVLIDKYHVITVAHCVFHLYKYNEYPLKVRLGEWDTQTTTEFLAHADYKVSKIIVHPEYKNTSLWNDIAILKLEDPVLFAPHIDTVCLPQYDEIFSEQNCVVTGWGKDAYKGGTFSNVMKEVALQVIDNYKCEEMLRKTRLGRFFQLHEGFLCAGGEYGLDSCKGDGGGPLVCYRKDRSYALAGIVSWGIDCGQPGVPGVYVKIQKYLDWISKITDVTLQDYWPKQ